MNNDLYIGLGFSTAYFMYTLLIGLTMMHTNLIFPIILGLIPFIVILIKHQNDKQKRNEQMLQVPVQPNQQAYIIGQKDPQQQQYQQPQIYQQQQQPQYIPNPQYAQNNQNQQNMQYQQYAQCQQPK